MTDGIATVRPGLVSLHLGQPPHVAQVGIGVHGTASLRDIFLLPDLWQLHLYRYSAELEVDRHLTRLFRAHTGETVIAHSRARRMQRARHLLQASTLPIATIAAAVGIPDLQAFNKVCRREIGLSPRAVRNTANDHCT